MAALTTQLPRRAAGPLMLILARLAAGTMIRRVQRAFGYRRPRRIALNTITVPDSTIVLAASELLETCSPPYLVNHCLRTYCFGMAIAEQLKLQPDREVLMLSALMHDLGLTKQFDGEDSFELGGARAAHGFLREHNYASEKSDLVHEAIALHSAAGIADKREPEIALVHFGAGMDVIGFRAEDIAPETRDDIVARHPRLKFKKQFTEALADQVTRNPQCHIAGHMALGLARKIEAAPFLE